MHVGKWTLQAVRHGSTLVVTGKWSLKDGLVRKEGRQDLTATGKTRK